MHGTTWKIEFSNNIHNDNNFTSYKLYLLYEEYFNHILTLRMKKPQPRHRTNHNDVF